MNVMPLSLHDLLLRKVGQLVRKIILTALACAIQSSCFTHDNYNTDRWSNGIYFKRALPIRRLWISQAAWHQWTSTSLVVQKLCKKTFEFFSFDTKPAVASTNCHNLSSTYIATKAFHIEPMAGRYKGKEGTWLCDIADGRNHNVWERIPLKCLNRWVACTSLLENNIHVEIHLKLQTFLTGAFDTNDWTTVCFRSCIVHLDTCAITKLSLNVPAEHNFYTLTNERTKARKEQ